MEVIVICGVVVFTLRTATLPAFCTAKAVVLLVFVFSRLPVLDRVFTTAPAVLVIAVPDTVLPIPMVVVLAVPMLIVPAPVVERARVPVPLTEIPSPAFEVLVLIRGVAPENVKFPPAVNVPLPMVISPLLVVCSDRVLAPTSQVEAPDAVIFRAADEFKASVRVPLAPVVEMVSGPLATVTVRPPVEGPVIVRAVVPLNVWLPPTVNVPVPVVIPPLLPVWTKRVWPAPRSQMELALAVKLSASAELSVMAFPVPSDLMFMAALFADGPVTWMS